MPVIRDVKIIKVPLSENERMPDYSQKFPPMPRLYLEIFENKAKIKQDLINKEFVPKEPVQGVENRHAGHAGHTGHTRHTENTENTETAGYVEKKEENTEIKEEVSPGEEKSSESSKSLSISSSKSSRSSRSSKSSRSSRSSSSTTSSFSSSKSNDSEELSDRLKQLLAEEDDDKDKRGDQGGEKERDKYSQKHKNSIGSKYTRPDLPPPPTLAELESKGHYQKNNTLRDINHIPASEYEEEDKKRELIFKFGLLRKGNPLATVPEYTIHSDLREMQKTYDDTVRNLSLDSSVGTYKKYLITGFAGVEFVFGKFLGFDMEGYTQQQIISINNYDQLLIELGEKSYLPSGSRWPVELRLLFMIILNTVIFILSKMVLRSTGASLLGMLNNLGTQNNNAPSTKPKRRMKGPDINIDDLPEATEVRPESEAKEAK